MKSPNSIGIPKLWNFQKNVSFLMNLICRSRVFGCVAFISKIIGRPYSEMALFTPPISYNLHCMLQIFIIVARVIIMSRVFLMDCYGLFVSLWQVICYLLTGVWTSVGSNNNSLIWHQHYKNRTGTALSGVSILCLVGLTFMLKTFFSKTAG